MSDTMREEFEKWHMERYGGFGLGRSTEPGYTDEYERVGTNLQWKAWQAARTVPDGFVMVPKGMLTEYLELLESSDMKAIHKLVRKHAVDAMLDTEMLSAAPEVKK